MKTSEMKTILFNKLKDENCNFKRSDISIRKINNYRYKITIKDYEHITFEMALSSDYDNYFGYIVIINDLFENACISFNDSKKGYDIENALIHLGYYIGNTF